MRIISAFRFFLLLIQPLMLPVALLAQGPPLVRVLSPEGSVIVLQRVDIHVEVAAGSSLTTWEATIANPGDRAIEAEWRLPLVSGQQIVGFALEIDGQWREATLTDRGRARRAYDTITGALRDPAILEKEKGPSCRLRVAPIPPRGSRRLRVLVRQLLRISEDGNGWRLREPFHVSPTPREGTFTLVIQGDTPTMESSPIPGLSLNASGLEKVSEASFAGHEIHGDLGLWWPSKVEGLVEAWRGILGPDVFGAARMSLPSLPGSRPVPKRILLAWDTSSSGVGRDRGRVLAAVEDRLAQCPQAELEVRVLGVRELASKTFLPSPQRLKDLKAFLAIPEAWGAFAWGSLKVEGFDEVLLISEGRALDAPSRAEIKAPVFALASNEDADMQGLRAFAQSHRGDLIDLRSLARSEVRALIARPRWRLVKVDVEGEIQALHPAAPCLVPSDFWISARLLNSSAILHFHFESEDGRSVDRELRWDTQTPESSLVPARWGEAELENLERDNPSDRSRLTSLGVHFALLTKDTALVALEKLEDYVTFQIEPPAAWRLEWTNTARGFRAVDEGWDVQPKEPNPVTPDDRSPLSVPASLEQAWEARRWWWQGRIPPNLPKPHPQDFCRPTPPFGFPGSSGPGFHREGGVVGGVIGGVEGGVIGGVVAGAGKMRRALADVVEQGPADTSPPPDDGLPLVWPASESVPSLKIMASDSDKNGAPPETALPDSGDLPGVLAYRRGAGWNSTPCALLLGDGGRIAFALQFLSEQFLGPISDWKIQDSPVRDWAWAACRWGAAADLISWTESHNLHFQGRNALDFADLLLADQQVKRVPEIYELLFTSPPPPPPPASPTDEMVVNSSDAPSLLALENWMAMQREGFTDRQLEKGLPTIGAWDLRVEISWTGEENLKLGLLDPAGRLVWTGDPIIPGSIGLDAAIAGGPFIFMARHASKGVYRIQACAPWRPYSGDVWVRIVVIRGFNSNHPTRQVRFVNLKGRSGLNTLLSFHSANSMSP